MNVILGKICNVLRRRVISEGCLEFWYGLLSILPNAGCLMVMKTTGKKYNITLNTSKNYQHIVEWIHFPTFSCELRDDICLTFSCFGFFGCCYRCFFCPLVVSGKSLSQQRMDKSHLFRIFFRILPSSEPRVVHDGQGRLCWAVG